MLKSWNNESIKYKVVLSDSVQKHIPKGLYTSEIFQSWNISTVASKLLGAQQAMLQLT
jgi:hypothetical protein